MKIIGKKGYDANLALSGEKVAYYHLPGLFEFYELYRVFLPLFRMHREYFYDWCEIGSIYGAPSDCIWGGGRTSFGTTDPRDVLASDAGVRHFFKADLQQFTASRRSILQIQSAMRSVSCFPDRKGHKMV